MKYLQLLGVWNRLKRQLRSIILRTGQKKPIKWMGELNEMLGIVNATLDARDETPEPTEEPKLGLTPSEKRRQRRHWRRNRE